MTELNIKYEELIPMDAEKAKEIISRYVERDSFLEDMVFEKDDEKYGAVIVTDDDWDDGGKYQYQTMIGALCKFDNDYNVIEMYDIALIQNITRCGSYFTDYYYEYEPLEISKIVKHTLPKVIIPEREIVTLKNEVCNG